MILYEIIAMPIITNQRMLYFLVKHSTKGKAPNNVIPNTVSITSSTYKVIPLSSTCFFLVLGKQGQVQKIVGLT